MFAGAGVEQYMWPGGRICSNCALARKRSAQSASTAWIFTGGDRKMESCGTVLELRELRGGGEGLVNVEQGVLYYFGTTRTWHLPCSMRKPNECYLCLAPCLCWPAVMKLIICQVCLEGACRIFNHLFTFWRRHSSTLFL